MSHAGGSVRVIVFAFLANLGIALAKFIGALVTHSTAMMAEAIHSAVDTSNQLLLLLGNKKSRKAPTHAHPMGYGREAFFWSFIVAIMLFSLGGLFAIYEGIHKFSEGGELQTPWIALIILLISLLLESFSFIACIKEVRRINTYGSMWRWFRMTTASELLVVFTEDLAALLGLIIATVALLLTWLTNNVMWDAIGSILVGVILVSVAVLLAIEIKSLIIGEAPATDFRSHIESQLQQLLPGARLLRLIALQMGAEDVMLSYKIHPGDLQDVPTLIRQINELEKRIQEKFPFVRWQFSEADYAD